MVDYQEYKVQIFPNINDAPSPPTAQKPGNGSHLINRFNGALEAIEGDITELQEQNTSLAQRSVTDPKIFNAIFAWGMGA